MQASQPYLSHAPQDKEGVDPTRVGGPSNPLLADGGLSTVIGKAVVSVQESV